MQPTHSWDSQEVSIQDAHDEDRDEEMWDGNGEAL